MLVEKGLAPLRLLNNIKRLGLPLRVWCSILCNKSRNFFFVNVTEKSGSHLDISLISTLGHCMTCTQVCEMPLWLRSAHEWLCWHKNWGVRSVVPTRAKSFWEIGVPLFLSQKHRKKAVVYHHYMLIGPLLWGGFSSSKELHTNAERSFLRACVDGSLFGTDSNLMATAWPTHGRVPV